jgi:thymidylate kinase
MNTIIAIEGISYAGKTTLSKNLVDDGFSRLEELAEKFGHGAGFPSFPKTNEDAKKSDLWFIEQEIIRSAESKTKADNAAVVCDRSFISGLAFAYARQKIFKLGDVSYQHDLIRSAAADGKLHVPLLVYLALDFETFFKRKNQDYERRLREYGVDAVTNVTVTAHETAFFSKQIEYYETIFAKPAIPYLRLDARQEPRILTHLVCDWISQLRQEASSIDIEDLFINCS